MLSQNAIPIIHDVLLEKRPSSITYIFTKFATTNDVVFNQFVMDFMMNMVKNGSSQSSCMALSVFSTLLETSSKNFDMLEKHFFLSDLFISLSSINLKHGIENF